MTPWEQLVKFIVDGEDVKATVANRAPQSNTNRTQYLYERLQSIAAGEALFLHYQKIESDAAPGDLVYFDESYNGYKKALAAVEFNQTAGWYTMADSSFVVGMVYSKTATETGHILTAGTLRDFDLSNAIIGGDATIPGAYYLSMQVAGKLTLQKPAVSLYMLYNRGDGTFHFIPTPRNVLEDHIHYKFELYAKPAGEANCIVRGDGQVHQVVDPDPDQTGWLPADHPVFQGAAPDGAKFGYNLAKHPELQQVWPPNPNGSCYIEQNGTGVPLNTEERPTVIVDCANMWWMEDCYGNAPWAPNYPGCESSSSSQSFEPESSSSGEPYYECHTPWQYLGLDDTWLDEKRLTLWYSKMVYKDDPNVVTELSPLSETTPVRYVDCDGLEASAGKLFTTLDLGLLDIVAPVSGIEVVKGFAADQIQKGPAVIGLKAGPGAEIEGVGTENVDWEVDDEGLYHGDLQVQLEDTTGDPKEYQVTLVALNDVLEDYDNANQFFYLAFPAGRTSGVRGRVEIPRLGLSTPLKMRLWCWFVGRSAGAIPTLTATYRRYPEPSGTPVLPTTDSNIGTGSWTPGITLAAGEYAQAYTDWFTVVMGDTVDFTLEWDGTSGPTDGFGIMRFGSRVEVGTP
jgi:hypothetical protein